MAFVDSDCDRKGVWERVGNDTQHLVHILFSFCPLVRNIDVVPLLSTCQPHWSLSNYPDLPWKTSSPHVHLTVCSKTQVMDGFSWNGPKEQVEWFQEWSGRSGSASNSEIIPTVAGKWKERKGKRVGGGSVTYEYLCVPKLPGYCLSRVWALSLTTIRIWHQWTIQCNFDSWGNN